MIISIITRKPMIDKKRCETCAYNVGYRINNPNVIWCDKHICSKLKFDTCDDYEWELWRLQSWSFN